MSPANFIDNPNWADFLPEYRGEPHRRSVPTHEDCSPLDAEATAAHLRRGGTLGTMEGYEERPGQIDMLKAIVRCFNAREHLMIEAGTGVGKSLAYLVPAILWAQTNDTTVVVSTATRNLQSQLIRSDIPKALAVLGPDRENFRVALLKGRANYLCLREVAEFFAAGYWTMSAEEQAEMPHFIEWLQTTEDGDLDTYDGLPRSILACPGEECSGRKCPWYSRCFVYRARRRASEANLVVANHALVLADATNPGGGVLPAHQRLILDEAHNLEETATEYLSVEFSLPALTKILNRLRRKGRGRRIAAGGILANVERQLQRGVLAGSPVASSIGLQLKKAASETVRLVNAAEGLADVAERMLGPSGGHGTVRYRVAEARQFSLHGAFKQYGPDEWDEDLLSHAQAAFEDRLAGLVNLLHEMRDALENAAAPGEFNFGSDLAQQVSSAADSLVTFANDTNFVLGGAKETHAFWAERVRPEKRPSYLRLVAAPLSVAEDLAKTLYDIRDSVVLSSATLRVGNDFRYTAKRLGCVLAGGAEPGRFQALVAASPFDYLRQALVLAPDCLPDPSAAPADYATALAGLMQDLFSATHGRALVLFTSYEMMNAVANAAAAPLSEAGIELLVQGGGLSREAITARLREAGDERATVVFGAQSFWEGVDVAGEALSCVVLARLPFAQVRDPIVEARAEQIDRAGGSSFRDYMLPEAVIRFRQGFGRLIRTKRDRGVVVVTDPRLVTKGYGAIFRKSIPASVRTVTDLDELVTRVCGFFEDAV